MRETIMYSASLRLSGQMGKEEREALVEKTMEEMGLRESADTPVGNWHLRGLSGGGKRRVSIALEILTRPKILFLDEPTSGLDRYVYLANYLSIYLFIYLKNFSHTGTIGGNPFVLGMSKF